MGKPTSRILQTGNNTDITVALFSDLLPITSSQTLVAQDDILADKKNPNDKDSEEQEILSAIDRNGLDDMAFAFSDRMAL